MPCVDDDDHDDHDGFNGGDSDGGDDDAPYYMSMWEIFFNKLLIRRVYTKWCISLAISFLRRIEISCGYDKMDFPCYLLLRTEKPIRKLSLSPSLLRWYFKSRLNQFWRKRGNTFSRFLINLSRWKQILPIRGLQHLSLYFWPLHILLLIALVSIFIENMNQIMIFLKVLIIYHIMCKIKRLSRVVKNQFSIRKLSYFS